MATIFKLFFIANTIIGVNLFYTYGLNVSLFNNVLLAIALILMCRNDSLFRNSTICRTSIFLLLLGHLLIYIFTLTVNLSTTLIAPAIIISAFPYKNIKVWKSCDKWLLYFYLIECFLSIFERIIHYNFFDWMPIGDVDYVSDLNGDSRGFRSTGLLGHPLQNALVVSFLMSFFLMSSYKLYAKVILWSIGFLAIMSFNTRSSMVGNALLFLIFVLKTLFIDKQSKNKDRIFLFSITIVLFIGILYAIFVLGFGDRLIEMGFLDDNSAQVRLDIWSLFDFVDFSTFMFGMADDKFSILLQKAGLFKTENFWIDFLFIFGIVYVIIALIVYLKLSSFLYGKASLFYRLFTGGTFLLVASTNNSLTTSWHVLTIFLLSIICFDEKNKLVIKHGK